jgi:biofilm PGA synthesis lipoprotein PgaB
VEIRGEALKINPKQKWAINIYYETPVHPNWGLWWYSHDIEGLWATGVDYLAVMAYQEQIQREMRLNDKEFLDFASKLGQNIVNSAPNPRQAIVKVQSAEFDRERTPVGEASFRTLCNTLRSAGVESFIQLPIDRPQNVQRICE